MSPGDSIGDQCRVLSSYVISLNGKSVHNTCCYNQQTSVGQMMFNMSYLQGRSVDISHVVYIGSLWSSVIHRIYPEESFEGSMYIWRFVPKKLEINLVCLLYYRRICFTRICVTFGNMFPIFTSTPSWQDFCSKLKIVYGTFLLIIYRIFTIMDSSDIVLGVSSMAGNLLTI